MKVFTIAESRECKVGDWRVQDGYATGDDHEVEQLREIECDDVQLTEDGYSERIVDANRAVLKRGGSTHPVDIHEADDGTWYVTDGKHRWWAHKLEGKPLRVWASPKGANGGMTHKELTGEKWTGTPTEQCTYAFWRRNHKLARGGGK